jgi:hypothetical protein
MDRWWLIPREWNCPICARIHHIKRPDADRDLHDHPAGYRTFLLKGWYIEENILGQIAVIAAGETTSGSAERFHRIVDVSHGGVWSLFILGKNNPEPWGFLSSKNGESPRKIPWHDYDSSND